MPPPYSSETKASELIAELTPHIQGKTILTTGVTPNSLGAFFVRALAKASPALLILAGRSPAKTQATADEIAAETAGTVPTKVLTLDLASLAAVRKAAEEANSWDDVPAIDVLVNNASIMAVEKYTQSPEGFESQLATNYLGPWLFTNLVMDKILKGKEPRVVNVSSDAHQMTAFRFGDYNFDNGETYNKWLAYGQSKTAEILMGVSLAKKLGGKGLLAFSVHPGVIFTNLGSHIDWQAGRTEELVTLCRKLGLRGGWAPLKFKSQDEGTATHVFAAFHPSLKEHNGAYLQDVAVGDPWNGTINPWATNEIEAERLWKLTEKLVGQEFSY